MTAQTGIGARVKRKEDQRFLTGTGRYVDDLPLARATYAHFVRSPHAHAKIKSIDTAAARRCRAWSRSSPARTSPTPRSAA
jgi:aerobic carbon-monoxide dehydrogenase large subunit